MGNYIENTLVHYIKNSREMDQDTESILRYGIKIIYYNISKLAIIFIFSYFLGIVKETCIVLLLIIIIRSFAFGFHTDTFLSCLIVTAINIFGIITFSSLAISTPLKILICSISLVLFVLYAPADTEERPLVDPKKRKKLKLQVLIIWAVYSIISLFVNKQLSNMLLLSLLFMAINTCPVLYIIFGKEYKNYEKI